MTTVNKIIAFLAIALLVYFIIVMFTNKPKTVKVIVAPTYADNAVEHQFPRDEQSTPPVGFRYTDDMSNPYGSYYVSVHNPVHIDADSCLAVPKITSDCINRRLIMNGNNLSDAVDSCNVHRSVLNKCVKNSSGYYYPYGTDRPYVTDYPYASNYEEPTTRKVYVVRTSLNAPMERTVMIKTNDSI